MLLSSRFLGAADVHIAVNSLETYAEETVQRIRDIGVNTEFFKANVSDFAQVQYMVQPQFDAIPLYAANTGAARQGVAYCTSKAAVMGFTVALVAEAVQQSVTVNAVAPGFVETAIFKRHPEERRRQLAEAGWLKRVANVEDVANAVTFLASASYVAGEIVDVNGGLVLDP